MTVPRERFRLDGRTAVVTGASSGVGLGFAITLAGAGADVVLGARRVERLDDVCRRIADMGGRAHAVPTDVIRPEDCEVLAQAAIDKFGRLDVLVNNAGTGTAVPALREQPADSARSSTSI